MLDPEKRKTLFVLLSVTGVPVESLVQDVDEVRGLFLNETSMNAEVVDSLLKSKLSLPSLVYSFISKHAECDESLIRSTFLQLFSSAKGNDPNPKEYAAIKVSESSRTRPLTAISVQA